MATHFQKVEKKSMAILGLTTHLRAVTNLAISGRLLLETVMYFLGLIMIENPEMNQMNK